MPMPSAETSPYPLPIPLYSSTPVLCRFHNKFDSDNSPRQSLTSEVEKQQPPTTPLDHYSPHLLAQDKRETQIHKGSGKMRRGKRREEKEKKKGKKKTRKSEPMS
jgi:hypothetical protein